MKISEQWLREWIPLRLDTQALAHRLTMAGLEVGAVVPVAAGLTQVVVGEILTAQPHPQADRLRLCEVNAGKGRRLTIVCGAANAAAGLKVPVAMIGARLPNGTEIQQTAIRGVTSHGMLCSAAELGLADASDGLLVLGDDAKPGTALTDYLGLDDQQMEIDLTPNRGDCLSIAGLARELAAITGTRVRAPRRKPVPVQSKLRRRVDLKAAADCPHYAGRVIVNIDPQATTPLWLSERLRRGGIRSIHPVVDITNYVMLELGQPMHAFDLDKLSGDIAVRPGRQGETLALLDGTSATLEKGDVVIADAKRPVALAGIMGGADTAVSATTTRVFLESAYFRPETISLHARRRGMHTDSSHRFERGVDPALQRLALERASSLIREITGGLAGPVEEKKVATHLPRAKAITIRRARISQILGVDIPAATIASILKRLGVRLTPAAGGWRAVAPSWRFDLTRECDLIEEVARIHGYEQIPPHRPRVALQMPAVPEGRLSEDRLRQILIDRDYQEIITYSFIAPALQAQLDPERAALPLANPIAADMAVMRTSLWPGLINTVLYNQNRQQVRIRLFELGRRFLPVDGVVQEEAMLAGALCGPVLAKQWGSTERVADFYDMKGDVEAVIAAAGMSGRWRFHAAEHPALHPGQSAEVVDGSGRRLGLLGALHPRLQGELGLDRTVYLFELALAGLTQAQIPAFREISKFPAVRRDLNLVVGETVAADTVRDRIAHVAGDLLVNLELFDEYRGEGIDSGRKSLTLGLTFQHSSRTLREDEIEAVVNKVISTLGSDLGAQLRQ